MFHTLLVENLFFLWNFNGCFKFEVSKYTVITFISMMIVLWVSSFDWINPFYFSYLPLRLRVLRTSDRDEYDRDKNLVDTVPMTLFPFSYAKSTFSDQNLRQESLPPYSRSLLLFLVLNSQTMKRRFTRPYERTRFFPVLRRSNSCQVDGSISLLILEREREE